MNRFKSYSKQPLWFIGLLLTALVAVAGCNPDDDNPSPGDVVAPTVTSTAPVNDATAVPTNRKITASFSEAMDPTTITSVTFTVTNGATPVSGAVTYVGTAAIFTPASNLATSTVFTATIMTGAKDLAGNALAANKIWTFTTGTVTDVTAPAVSSTNPNDAATAVPINRKIIASFSEAMDPATITSATFTVTNGATPVSGAVTYVSTTATFTPASHLAPSTVFTATITTGAKDLAGNALAANKIWTFTTGTAVAVGPAPVVLGTAGNFVILSKSGITNVPTSKITGAMGTSPITGASITGLTCAEVTGTIYTVDTVGPPAVSTGPAPCSVVDKPRVDTAVLDMQTAYTDAAGRTLPDFTELGSGDISGLTLVPGLYKWGTGVSINTDVTLAGGPTDVWIFQIAGTFTQAAGTKVHLSGGALAKHIFWQVAGVTSMKATAHFEGVVLSQTEIDLLTGASVNGRLLAQTAVTLQSNTVAQPAP